MNSIINNGVAVSSTYTRLMDRLNSLYPVANEAHFCLLQNLVLESLEEEESIEVDVEFVDEEDVRNSNEYFLDFTSPDFEDDDEDFDPDNVVLDCEILAGHCPLCDVSAGEFHEPDCDLEICTHCGFRKDADDFPDISNDAIRLPWPGEWPGERECKELGLGDFSSPSDREQFVALEQLRRCAHWDASGLKWVAGSGDGSTSSD